MTRGYASRFVLGLLAFSPLVVGPLLAQDVGKPVPPEWVTSGKLTVTQKNFAVSAPADWSWRQLDLAAVDGAKMTGFVAVSPDDTNRFVVTVWEKSSPKALTQGDAEGYVRGMRESLATGWGASNVQIQDTEIPLPGSSYIRVMLTSPDGTTSYQFRYFVYGNLSYSLIANGPESTEPASFTAFARSFRLIDPTRNDVPADSSQGIMGLVFLGSVVAAILDWRYVRRGGVHPTGREKALFGIAAVLCVGLLVTLGVGGATPESLGHESFFLFVVMFGLWELSRFGTRRSHPLPKAE